MNKEFLKTAFESLSYDVLVNDVPQKAVITQAELGSASRRHMQSLEPFQQGDYVQFGNGKYLVIQEVMNTRAFKYKATIEYCNYTITTPEKVERIRDGRNEFGEPNYIYVTTPGFEIDVILRQDKMAIKDGVIRLNLSSLEMLLPDAAKFREEIKINAEIMVYDLKYKIVDINRVRTGLMETTLEKTP